MMKIDWDVPITLADGLVLRADVFRPVDAGKYPVIISYYAMNQWQVAVLQPPHLAAICIWEGAADYYRDLSHHGGILCTFGRAWFPSQVVRVQHGRGTRGYRSRMNGDWVSGPPTLSEEELGANRNDFYEDCWKNPLASDGYWRSRMPDWSQARVPLV